MMVALRNGLAAIIDSSDAALIGQYSWSASRCKNSLGGHYASSRRDGKTIYMHRLIIGAASGELVDHINFDGLDNRRVNLRICTRSDNNAHRRQQVGASGFRGVWPKRGKFRAVVYRAGKPIYLGTFVSAEEAAAAYDAAAREVYGDFAVLNFQKCADQAESTL